MTDIVNIKEIEKLHPDEWLLFEVVEGDEQNHPVKGRLLAHSKDRNEVHKAALHERSKDKLLYTFFSGECVPKDVAVAL